jgi:hypothetical protein
MTSTYSTLMKERGHLGRIILIWSLRKRGVRMWAAEDTDQCWALVNTMMRLQVAQTPRNVSTERL